jgi:iron complex outermembrane receptor protein
MRLRMPPLLAGVSPCVLASAAAAAEPPPPPAAASLRGVTFDVNTTAEPPVALYLNDAPVQANALFDIGQVEALKGPQGATRGVSAPSGAITATHKPDLSEFGGYADVTLTDLQARNVQAAVNIPKSEPSKARRYVGA